MGREILGDDILADLNYLSRLRKAMSYSNFVLWAYLDILDDKHRCYYDFFNEARANFAISLIRNIRLLLIGDYEQKEQVKLYFRNITPKHF